MYILCFVLFVVLFLGCLSFAEVVFICNVFWCISCNAEVKKDLLAMKLHKPDDYQKLMCWRYMISLLVFVGFVTVQIATYEQDQQKQLHL